MADREILEMDYIDTVIDGKPVRLISPFSHAREIVSIQDIERPGVYGGINIFDPSLYGTGREDL